MASSVYRKYFEAISGTKDKVRCTVKIEDKACGKEVDSKKASNLQDHLRRHHQELYETIQASPKSARSSNQPSIDSFAIAVSGKFSGATRDLLMGFATSTVPINLLNNPSFKVSIF